LWRLSAAVYLARAFAVPLIAILFAMSLTAATQNARKDMHLLIDAALHGAGLAIVMEDEVARFIVRWTLGPVEDWSPPLSGFHLYYREQRTKCDQCGAAHAFELRAAIGFVGL
jgi:DNA-binding transcriptional LysR family regulator